MAYPQVERGPKEKGFKDGVSDGIIDVSPDDGASLGDELSVGTAERSSDGIEEGFEDVDVGLDGSEDGA
jgi:hypothetical protein